MNKITGKDVRDAYLGMNTSHYDNLTGELMEMYNRVADMANKRIEQAQQVRSTLHDCAVAEQQIQELEQAVQNLHARHVKEMQALQTQIDTQFQANVEMAGAIRVQGGKIAFLQELVQDLFKWVNEGQRGVIRTASITPRDTQLVQLHQRARKLGVEEAQQNEQAFYVQQMGRAARALQTFPTDDQIEAMVDKGVTVANQIASLQGLVQNFIDLLEDRDLMIEDCTDGWYTKKEDSLKLARQLLEKEQ